MKFIIDSQVTFFNQIMTLFNIELFMTLGSSAFNPYRFLCSHPSRHLCSLLKHASPSSTFILVVAWTHIDLCHAWNLLYQFEFSIQSHTQAFQFKTLYICINSYLIHLIASFDNNIHHIWQVLINLKLCISVSCLIHKFFSCHLNPIISRTSLTY